MEYRAWITVPDMPVSAQSEWEPFLQRLENDHGDLGPVLGWNDDEAEVVLAIEAPDSATAADALTRAVYDALRAVGRGDIEPSQATVERALDLESL